MKTWTLEREQWVPLGLGETFAFFADAANLERLTPGFLGFRFVTPLPIAMRAGTLIEYRLRLFSVPLSWLTRIEAWEPGARFVDRQLRGPYARWVHTHSFERSGAGTLVRDHVEYALPLDPLSRPVHALFVRPTLERIFDFRRAEIARALGAAPGAEAPH